MAEDALMRALEQGTVGGSATWSNPSDPERPAEGRATLIARDRSTGGETCWRVRVESRVGTGADEVKTQKFCRVGRNGWREAGE